MQPHTGSASFVDRGGLPKGFVEVPVTWSGFFVGGEERVFEGTIQVQTIVHYYGSVAF